VATREGAAEGTSEDGVATDASVQRRGIIDMLVASVSLGTLGPVASLGYQAGLAPATFGALRAAIGAAILGTLTATGRQPRVRLRSLPKRQALMLALAVLANALQNLFLFFAYDEMAVAPVLMLFWLNPGIIAVASAVLGRERLTGTRVAALALAGAGLVLVLGGQASGDALVTLAGVVLACLAAACHATYYLVVRDGFPDVPAVQATSLVLAGGVLISGVVAVTVEGLAIDGGWLTTPAAWAAIIVAGTLGAAIPKVLVIRGVRTIGSTRAALVALVEPVTGVVVAAVVLGQTLSPAQIAGGMAIFVAAAVVQRRAGDTGTTDRVAGRRAPSSGEAASTDETDAESVVAR
jgi:DME family drug/metabolite transporter